MIVAGASWSDKNDLGVLSSRPLMRQRGLQHGPFLVDWLLQVELGLIWTCTFSIVEKENRIVCGIGGKNFRTCFFESISRVTHDNSHYRSVDKMLLAVMHICLKALDLQKYRVVAFGRERSRTLLL